MDESICHICAICNRLLKQVEGRQMCPLRLEVGLEHDNGILSPEIGLPGVGVFHGYQINFVQDENDLFVRHGQYFAFNVLAPARKRVPCVEHLKDNIAILDDFFHFLPVFAGLLKVFGFEVASAFFVLLDVLLELPLLHVVLDVG